MVEVEETTLEDNVEGHSRERVRARANEIAGVMWLMKKKT